MSDQFYIMTNKYKEYETAAACWVHNILAFNVDVVGANPICCYPWTDFTWYAKDRVIPLREDLMVQSLGNVSLCVNTAGNSLSIHSEWQPCPFCKLAFLYWIVLFFGKLELIT